MRKQLLIIAMFAGCCLSHTLQAQTLTVTDTIFDRKAHEKDFAFGADLSGVPMYASNSWLDKNGKQKDIMQIMKDQGINSVRLRVWTVNSGGSSKQEVVNMAKRAKQYGMSVMIDFHYCDSWADPGKQPIPSAWTDHSANALAQKVYDHTYDVLKAVKAAGVTPRWVQVGNETRNGMLWPTGSFKESGGKQAFAKFVKSGYDAVKAVDSTMQVIVHLDRGHDNGVYRSVFDALKNNGGKWDIIGLSAYPRWSHLDGPTMISKVMANIKDLKKRYGTPCMVVETGHYPSEAIAGNQYIVGLIDAMIKDGDLTGCYYWAPETLWGYDMGAWDASTKKPTVMMDAFLGIKHTAVNWVMKNTISAPGNDQTVRYGEPVTLSADVKHIRNRAMEVTYYIDGTLKGNVKTAPYELTVDGLQAGLHKLWSNVSDAEGHLVKSDTTSFYAGSSLLLGDPTLSEAEKKGGTATWNLDFKAAGKYLLEFKFSSPDGIRGCDINLDGSPIGKTYFMKKTDEIVKAEIEVPSSGKQEMQLVAILSRGIPQLHSVRIYPLEGQTVEEIGGSIVDGIDEQQIGGETPVSIYSLTGRFMGSTTAEEAGLPHDWDGKPLIIMTNGKEPCIVKMMR